MNTTRKTNFFKTSQNPSNTFRNNDDFPLVKPRESFKKNTPLNLTIKKNRREKVKNYLKTLHNKRSNAFSASRNKANNKDLALKTLGRFFKNVNPDKRRAYFLNSVCSDSGVCIAFGKESNTIKKHFNYFSDFKYLTGNAITIGSPSANGFVKELTYYNEGYRANAILKSTTQASSDNLIYEAYVGNYLNRVGLQYPCFLETYGAYMYTSTPTYETMKTTKYTPVDIILNGMRKIDNINTPSQIRSACTNPLLATSLLIQHLKGAITLQDKTTDIHFLARELFYVLCQVYFPLSALRNTFTHYDLHTSNILLYEPVVGSYMEYHYYKNNGTFVSFRSRYIVKIIDYGRCFFKDSQNSTFSGSSITIYNTVCSILSCGHCGENVGFSWLESQHLPHLQRRNYYISSQKRNLSHDLRALSMLSSIPPTDMRFVPNVLQDILNMVHYEDNYGTPEITNSGLPTRIKNVSDAATALFNAITNVNVSGNYDYYTDNSKKLGDLYIYENGTPMVYQSNPDYIKI